MKKIYQHPQTFTVYLHGEKAIMGILSDGRATIDTSDTNAINAGDEWAKRDNSSSYDVWKDDWSE